MPARLLTRPCQLSYVLPLLSCPCMPLLASVNEASEPNTVIFGLSYSISASAAPRRSDMWPSF